MADRKRKDLYEIEVGIKGARESKEQIEELGASLTGLEGNMDDLSDRTVDFTNIQGDALRQLNAELDETAEKVRSASSAEIPDLGRQRAVADPNEITRRLEEEGKNIGSAMKDASDAGEDLDDTLGSLNKEVDEFSEKVKGAGDNTKSLAQKIVEAGGTVSDDLLNRKNPLLEDEINNVKDAADEVSAPVEEASQSVGDLEERLESTGVAADDLGDSVVDSGGKVEEFARGAKDEVGDLETALEEAKKEAEKPIEAEVSVPEEKVEETRIATEDLNAEITETVRKFDEGEISAAEFLNEVEGILGELQQLDEKQGDFVNGIIEGTTAIQGSRGEIDEILRVIDKIVERGELPIGREALVTRIANIGNALRNIQTLIEKGDFDLLDKIRITDFYEGFSTVDDRISDVYEALRSLGDVKGVTEVRREVVQAKKDFQELKVQIRETVNEVNKLLEIRTGFLRQAGYKATLEEVESAESRSQVETPQEASIDLIQRKIGKEGFKGRLEGIDEYLTQFETVVEQQGRLQEAQQNLETSSKRARDAIREFFSSAEEGGDLREAFKNLQDAIGIVKRDISDLTENIEPQTEEQRKALNSLVSAYGGVDAILNQLEAQGLKAFDPVEESATELGESLKTLKTLFGTTTEAQEQLAGNAERLSDVQKKSREILGELRQEFLTLLQAEKDGTLTKEKLAEFEESLIKKTGVLVDMNTAYKRSLGEVEKGVEDQQKSQGELASTTDRLVQASSEFEDTNTNLVNRTKAARTEVEKTEEANQKLSESLDNANKSMSQMATVLGRLEGFLKRLGPGLENLGDVQIDESMTRLGRMSEAVYLRKVPVEPEVQFTEEQVAEIEGEAEGVSEEISFWVEQFKQGNITLGEMISVLQYSYQRLTEMNRQQSEFVQGVEDGRDSLLRSRETIQDSLLLVLALANAAEGMEELPIGREELVVRLQKAYDYAQGLMRLRRSGRFAPASPIEQRPDQRPIVPRVSGDLKDDLDILEGNTITLRRTLGGLAPDADKGFGAVISSVNETIGFVDELKEKIIDLEKEVVELLERREALFREFDSNKIATEALSGLKSVREALESGKPLGAAQIEAIQAGFGDEGLGARLKSLKEYQEQQALVASKEITLKEVIGDVAQSIINTNTALDEYARVSEEARKNLTPQQQNQLALAEDRVAEAIRESAQARAQASEERGRAGDISPETQERLAAANREAADSINELNKVREEYLGRAAEEGAITPEQQQKLKEANEQVAASLQALNTITEEYLRTNKTPTTPAGREALDFIQNLHDETTTLLGEIEERGEGVFLPLSESAGALKGPLAEAFNVLTQFSPVQDDLIKRSDLLAKQYQVTQEKVLDLQDALAELVESYKAGQVDPRLLSAIEEKIIDTAKSMEKLEEETLRTQQTFENQVKRANTALNKQKESTDQLTGSTRNLLSATNDQLGAQDEATQAALEANSAAARTEEQNEQLIQSFQKFRSIDFMERVVGDLESIKEALAEALEGTDRPTQEIKFALEMVNQLWEALVRFYRGAPQLTGIFNQVGEDVKDGLRDATEGAADLRNQFEYKPTEPGYDYVTDSLKRYRSEVRAFNDEGFDPTEVIRRGAKATVPELEGTRKKLSDTDEELEDVGDTSRRTSEAVEGLALSLASAEKFAGAFGDAFRRALAQNIDQQLDKLSKDLCEKLNLQDCLNDMKLDFNPLLRQLVQAYHNACDDIRAAMQSCIDQGLSFDSVTDQFVAALKKIEVIEVAADNIKVSGTPVVEGTQTPAAAGGRPRVRQAPEVEGDILSVDIVDSDTSDTDTMSVGTLDVSDVEGYSPDAAMKAVFDALGSEVDQIRERVTGGATPRSRQPVNIESVPGFESVGNVGPTLTNAQQAARQTGESVEYADQALTKMMGSILRTVGGLDDLEKSFITNAANTARSTDEFISYISQIDKIDERHIETARSIATVKDELDKINTAARNIRPGEFDALTESSAALEEKSGELRQQISDLQNQIDDLGASEGYLEGLVDEEQALINRSGELKSEIADINSAIDGIGDSEGLSALVRESTTVDSELVSVEQRLSAVANELSELNLLANDITILTVEEEQLKEELENVRSAANELELDLEQATDPKEVTEMWSALEGMRDREQEVAERLRVVTGELDRLSIGAAAIRGLESEYDSLVSQQKELVARQAEVNEEFDKLGMSATEVRTLLDEKRLLSQQLTVVSDKLENVQSDLDQAFEPGEIIVAREELERLTDHQQNLLTRLSEIDSKLGTTFEGPELLELVNRLASAEGELEGVESRIESVRGELGRLEDAGASDLLKQQQELNEEFEKTEDELAKVRRKIADSTDPAELETLLERSRELTQELVRLNKVKLNISGPGFEKAQEAVLKLLDSNPKLYYQVARLVAKHGELNLTLGTTDRRLTEAEIELRDLIRTSREGGGAIDNLDEEFQGANVSIGGLVNAIRSAGGPGGGGGGLLGALSGLAGASGGAGRGIGALVAAIGGGGATGGAAGAFTALGGAAGAAAGPAGIAAFGIGAVAGIAVKGIGLLKRAVQDLVRWLKQMARELARRAVRALWEFAKQANQTAQAFEVFGLAVQKIISIPEAQIKLDPVLEPTLRSIQVADPMVVEATRDAVRRFSEEIGVGLEKAAFRILPRVGSLEEFRQAGQLIRQLAASAPDLNYDDALRSFTEALAGDTVSLRRSFEINTDLINRLQDEIGLVPGLLVGLRAELSNMGLDWENIKNSTEVVVDRIKEFFVTMKGIVGTPLIEALNEQLNKLLDNIEDNRGEIDAFATQVGEIFGAVVTKVGQIINDIVAGDTITKVRKLFYDVENIVREVALAFNVLKTGASLVVDVFSLLYDTIKGIFQIFSPTFQLLKAVPEAFGVIKDSVLDTESVFGTFGQIVAKIGDVVVGFASVTTKVIVTLQTLKDNLKLVATGQMSLKDAYEDAEEAGVEAGLHIMQQWQETKDATAEAIQENIDALEAETEAMNENAKAGEYLASLRGELRQANINQTEAAGAFIEAIDELNDKTQDQVDNLQDLSDEFEAEYGIPIDFEVETRTVEFLDEDGNMIKREILDGIGDIDVPVLAKIEELIPEGFDEATDKFSDELARAFDDVWGGFDPTNINEELIYSVDESWQAFTERVKQNADKLNHDLMNIDFSQGSVWLEFELENARKRRDINQELVDDLDKIWTDYEQDRIDATIDLNRAERDAEIEYQRDIRDLARETAKKKIENEIDLARKLRDIRRQFAFDAEEAIRENDVVAYLEARRRMQKEVRDAETDYSDKEQDILAEEEDARSKAEQARADDLEDARRANADKLEDIALTLQRETEARLEQYRIDVRNQRQAEQDKLVDIRLATQKALEEYLKRAEGIAEAANEGLKKERDAVETQEAQILRFQADAYQARLDLYIEYWGQRLRITDSFVRAENALLGLGVSPNNPYTGPYDTDIDQEGDAYKRVISRQKLIQIIYNLINEQPNLFPADLEEELLFNIDSFTVEELMDILRQYAPEGVRIPSDIDEYAKGGRFSSGLALVGEEGPELVEFDGTGRVIPASRVGARMREISLDAIRSAAVVGPTQMSIPDSLLPNSALMATIPSMSQSTVVDNSRKTNVDLSMLDPNYLSSSQIQIIETVVKKVLSEAVG